MSYKHFWNTLEGIIRAGMFRLFFNRFILERAPSAILFRSFTNRSNIFKNTFYAFVLFSKRWDRSWSFRLFSWKNDPSPGTTPSLIGCIQRKWIFLPYNCEPCYSAQLRATKFLILTFSFSCSFNIIFCYTGIRLHFFIKFCFLKTTKLLVWGCSNCLT